MDLVKLPSILRRWLWVIVSVVAVTGLVLGLRSSMTPAVYEAQVRIQITAPPAEGVPLLDTGNRSASYLRDDLTLVRNNLLVVVGSREVYDRTIQHLGLQGHDRAYQVDVRPLRDSDFIDLLISVQTPDRAPAIANTHAQQAIKYYGELRAKPAAALKAFLATQLASTQGTMASGTEAAPAPTPSAAGTVEARDAEARQAHETYQLLLKKHAEAALAEEQALRAHHIQVVEPAAAPTRRAWARNFGTLVGLSLVGSLGLGLLLAMLLESLFPRTSRAQATPASRMTRSANGVARSSRPAWPPSWTADPATRGANGAARSSRSTWPSWMVDAVTRSTNGVTPSAVVDEPASEAER